MKNFSILFIIFLITISACRSSRTSRHINKAISPRDTVSTPEIIDGSDSLNFVNTTLEGFRKNYIDFRTFSAKAKVEVEDSKGKQPDLTATIRVIKDSAIWVSLTATFLNVEVFRVFITKDSVILLNKQNKEVQYRSLDYLQVVTELPFDFYTLQDIIIGNPVFFNDEKVSIKKFEKFITISSLTQDFKNLITIAPESSLLLHSKLDDVDIYRNRTADLTYDDYTNIGSVNFSTTRHIVVAEKNRIDIRMNFKQVEFNKELSVAFSVPKNYKRK